MLLNKKILYYALIVMFCYPYMLCAKTNSNELNVSNHLTVINVVSSNLSYTKGSSFFVPGMEDKISLTNGNHSSLNTSLIDVVKNISALQVSGGPRRVGQSFSMRGFDKNGIVLLIDDVPVSFLSQHTNFLPMSLLPTSSIDVIRGPFSALYGSNALGGVVSLKTINTEDLLIKGHNKGVTVSASYDSAKQKFNVIGTGYAKNNFSDFLGSIAYMTSEDTKTGKHNKINIPESDEQYSGMLKSNFFINNQTLSLAYYFNLDDVTVPGNPQQDILINSKIKKNTNIDYNINLQNHTLKLAHEFDSKTNKLISAMKTVLYFNYAKHKEVPQEDFATFGKFKPFYSKGDNLGKRNYLFGGLHKENLNFVIKEDFWSSLVYGIDYKFHDQKRNNEDPRGLLANARSHNLGIFIQDELFLTNYVTLQGALRYDYFDLENTGESNEYINKNYKATDNSKTYNQFSPKVSFTVKPADPVMIYTSYGRAFKTPNLNEMYASGIHFKLGPMINMLIPNHDLKPTISDTIEVGYGINFKDIQKIGGDFALKNAFYYTTAKDFITLAVTRATSQYVNVSSVKMQGIDLTMNYENQSHKASIAYNYIHAIDLKRNANLLNISENTFKFNYEYILPTTKWFLGTGILAQSSFDMANDTNTSTITKMPGFATFDLYTGIKSTNYRLSFGIDNILDKFYYNTFSSLPAVGRNYKILFTIVL